MLMLRYVLATFLAMATMVSASDVLANDSVSIRYLDGHPIPGRSMDREEIKISRVPSPSVGSKSPSREIDRFFGKIEDLMAAGRIDHDWQLAIPDAPSIEIVIELDGKKRTLVSCHTLLERDAEIVVTENGLERVARGDRKNRLAKQSEAFRRHRDAFEAILRLSLERAQSRFVGDS